MKRMLFNATQPEELRVALVDGQRLFDLDIESSSREQKKANIYKGKITRIEPSLEAAFVDYGAERHGFLPFKEVSRSYFDPSADTSGRINIKEVLKEGQEIVVQVDKEERGNKGAALTTFISLAGRYLVLMPNNPRAGGVSRRISGEDRSEIREVMSDLNVPENMGLIVRTAGVGKTNEELQWDLDYLLHLWSAISTAVAEKPAPFLIYQESNVVIRAIRDYFRKDINEILIDDPDVFNQAQEFVRLVMPYNLNKVKLYQDKVPLFTRYQIESQIESAFQREVRLPSGGAIVIDHTEALVSIDINSARATKGGDIEETALMTNLEAADEIARQLRQRDLGGLIVIDFIDMTSARNQREVENRLKEALKLDRARVQIGRISRFGLLEMSRQRLRPSLGESSQIICPRCKGQGTIRGTESLALSILRIIEEEGMKENTKQIVSQVPVDVATFLLNEKRHVINSIEERQKIDILVIPNSDFHSPHYEVKRIRQSDSVPEDSASYEMATKQEQDLESLVNRPKPVIEEPAVKTVVPPTPAPRTSGEKKPGILTRILKALFGSKEKATAKRTQSTTKSRPQRATTGHQTQRQQRPSTNQRGGRDRTGRQPQHGHQSKGNTNPPVENAENRQQTGDTSAQRSTESNAPRPSTRGGDSSNQYGSPGGRRGRRGGNRRRRRGGSDQASGSETDTNVSDNQRSDNGGSESGRRYQPNRNQEPNGNVATPAKAQPTEQRSTTSESPKETVQPAAAGAGVAASRPNEAKEPSAKAENSRDTNAGATSQPGSSSTSSSEGPASRAPDRNSVGSGTAHSANARSSSQSGDVAAASANTGNQKDGNNGARPAVQSNPDKATAPAVTASSAPAERASAPQAPAAPASNLIQVETKKPSE